MEKGGMLENLSEVLLPLIIIFILIPLAKRIKFSKQVKEIKKNLSELRNYIPGDISTSNGGIPFFKGRYGGHGLTISFERNKNETRMGLRIVMGLSSGFPVKIYGARTTRGKRARTTLEGIDKMLSIESPFPDRARSLIMSISTDDITILGGFLGDGISISSDSITLLKRNSSASDVKTKRLLRTLEIIGRIAASVQRL